MAHDERDYLKSTRDAQRRAPGDMNEVHLASPENLRKEIRSHVGADVACAQESSGGGIVALKSWESERVESELVHRCIALAHNFGAITLRSLVEPSDITL